MGKDYDGINIGPRGDETGRADDECAALIGDDFIGLINMKRGHYFTQDYQSIESFREEMKKHINDVVWGVLLRRETGNSVDIFRPGTRQKIGLADTEPKRSTIVPEGLNANQAALREAAINHFKSIKYKAYISEQLMHINTSLQLSGEIRNLFDQHGNPPANVPLEDIVAEREKTENAITWLEAICAEMRNNLTRIKEIEDFALALLAKGIDKE